MQQVPRREFHIRHGNPEQAGSSRRRMETDTLAALPDPSDPRSSLDVREQDSEPRCSLPFTTDGEGVSSKRSGVQLLRTYESPCTLPLVCMWKQP